MAASAVQTDISLDRSMVCTPKEFEFRVSVRHGVPVDLPQDRLLSNRNCGKVMASKGENAGTGHAAICLYPCLPSAFPLFMMSPVSSSTSTNSEVGP